MSIYASFDTDVDRDDWFDFHIKPETSPVGGPVFSWSTEDESGYRDLIAELVVALEPFARFGEYIDLETDGFSGSDVFELIIGDHLMETFKVFDFSAACAALTKAKEQMK